MEMKNIDKNCSQLRFIMQGKFFNLLSRASVHRSRLFITSKNKQVWFQNFQKQILKLILTDKLKGISCFEG